jgi:hypothetical protein
VRASRRAKTPEARSRRTPRGARVSSRPRPLREAHCSFPSRADGTRGRLSAPSAVALPDERLRARAHCVRRGVSPPVADLPSTLTSTPPFLAAGARWVSSAR